MSGFNFADSYKAAGLNPGPAIISLRQKPFDKLLKQINAQMVVDLTRLYFGLPAAQGTEWFRSAFGDNDTSFSMVDNEQEVAVLSACLLDAAISKHDVSAALAVLTVSACGTRTPLVLPDLIENARVALIEIARDQRHSESLIIKQFKSPTNTDLHEKADELVATPAWPQAAELFKQVSDESINITKNLATHVQDTLSPLAEQVEYLREEVSMLWWHIGGWSNVLDRPFVDLEQSLSAIMAGLDLADLSQTLAGPAAAPAILHRTVLAGRNGSDVKTSIKEAVNSYPPDAFTKLELSEELKNVPDICPVLTGFLKANEVGESPAWEIAFKKVVGFDPSVEFELLDLAMQVYRERSLLAALD